MKRNVYELRLLREGCKNCGDFFDADTMQCVNFTGVAAIVDPQGSWIARWLGRRE